MFVMWIVSVTSFRTKGFVVSHRHCLGWALSQSFSFMMLLKRSNKHESSEEEKSREINWDIKMFSVIIEASKDSGECRKVTRIYSARARSLVGGAVYQIFSSDVRFCWLNNMSKKRIVWEHFQSSFDVSAMTWFLDLRGWSWSIITFFTTIFITIFCSIGFHFYLYLVSLSSIPSWSCKELLSRFNRNIFLSIAVIQ